MSEATIFYEGDPWYVEAEVDNAKTKEPGKPGAVTGTVYSPAEWERKERGEAPPGDVVTFSETGDGEYEVLAVASLSEPGIWRIVVDTTAPLKGVQPGLITVQPLTGL